MYCSISSPARSNIAHELPCAPWPQSGKKFVPGILEYSSLKIDIKSSGCLAGGIGAAVVGARISVTSKFSSIYVVVCIAAPFTSIVMS